MIYMELENKKEKKKMTYYVTQVENQSDLLVS